MKNLKEIQNEIPYTDVFPIEDFIKYVKSGFITDWDGSGAFHDGEIETSVDVVCNMAYLESVKHKYP